MAGVVATTLLGDAHPVLFQRELFRPVVGLVVPAFWPG